jgi:hypothetical protein
MGWLRRTWRTFSGWPRWAQILTGIVIVVIIGAAASGKSKSPSATTTTNSSAASTSVTLTATEPTHLDGMGDPYVSEAQVRQVKVGMSAIAAFRTLGGKAPSGYNGVQAVPPLSYDYPISGTGSGDAGDATNNSYTWLQVCVKKNTVSGTVRGKLESLGNQC